MCVVTGFGITRCSTRRRAFIVTAFCIERLAVHGERKIPGTDIEFASSFVYGRCQDDPLVYVEPWLKGEFVKVNSSSGWKARVHDHNHDVAQAFSHWTWAFTGGALFGL